MRLLVASAPGAQPQADALAAVLGGAARLAIESRRFPDAERYVRVEGDVGGASVAVVAALRDPDPQALGLLFLAECLRELGAARIGLVAPYLPYMRQDHRFLDGEAVTSRSFARFVSGCFDWVATVDPHLHRIRTLSEIYAVPAAVASSAGPIGRWVAAQVDSPLIVGPDQESGQWVGEIARELGCPSLMLSKQRQGDRKVEISAPDRRAVAGRTPVVIDDIISSAQTMCATVGHLAALGARPVCVGVHALMTDEAVDELLHAGAARVVTCNTLVHRTNAIDVLPELAASVRALA